MKLFVYGTLMRGFSRARHLSYSQYLGNGHIEGELYDIAAFPGIIAGNEQVFGELYEITLDILERLDLIEDYEPENLADSLYLRKDCTVHLENGEITTAVYYCYNRSVDGREKIECGNYRLFCLQTGVDSEYFHL